MCHFSWTRPGQDFYIALIQSTSRAFQKHKEPMSYTDRSAHANKAKSSFKFQVLFVTYTTIQRLYNQQWNESRVRSMDSANIEKTTQGK